MTADEMGGLATQLSDLEALVAQEALAAAAVAGRSILRRYPRHLATYRQMAWVSLLGEQPEQAIDLLRRVLAADPEDGDCLAQLAQTLQEQGRGSEASSLWALAFDLCPWGVTWPRSVDVRAGLRRFGTPREPLGSGRLWLTQAAFGHLLARGRRWPRAVHVLRPLVKEAPERLDLKLALAGALWQLGEGRTAQALAREVLNRLPYALKANMILAGGSGREADDARQHVEQMDPTGIYGKLWFGDSFKL